MNALDLLMLAVAGATGGLAVWTVSRLKQRVPVRVRAKYRRR